MLTPSSKRRSFFIKCGTPNGEAISSGFRWLVENADKNQKSFVAVPSARSLKRTMQSVLGESAVRALATNGRINFNKILLRVSYN